MPILVIVGIVIGIIKWISHLKETPEEKKHRLQKEMAKGGGDILEDPYSDWPKVGVMSLIAGGAIAAFGVFLLFSDESRSDFSSTMSGLLYGPNILISGLLLMIFGILCIIAGFNHCSEQRLEALQLLAKEQNHYLESLLENKAYEDFCASSGSLIENTDVQNHVHKGRRMLRENMREFKDENN